MFQVLKLIQNVFHCVIPAKAGIYFYLYRSSSKIDSRLRGNDTIKNHLILKFLLVFFCLFYSTFALALPEDREKTLHIVADSYQFNYKTGQDIYEGHVKVDQGTTHLTADRLITQKNPQHKVIYAIAYGLQQLAEYITIPKPGDLELHAKAKMIKYYPLTSTIILDKNVAVHQGQNSFQGAHLVYDMKEQTVTAPASKSGRATIVIEPSQLKS